MKVYYWSPHIDQVATVRAVINSASYLSLYSKNEYNQINKFKINSKKSSRNFSIFKHYNDLSLILKKYD